MNQCPHPDCERIIPRTRYACAPHWFTLPKEIQNHIQTAYRTSARDWLEADKKAKAFWNKEEPPVRLVTKRPT